MMCNITQADTGLFYTQKNEQVRITPDPLDRTTASLLHQPFSFYIA